jgi:hypothetical protein
MMREGAALCREASLFVARLLPVLLLPLSVFFAAPSAVGATLIDCKSAAFAKLMTDPDFACEELRSWTLTPGAAAVTLRTLRDADDDRSPQFEALVTEAAEKSLATFSQ